MHVRRPALTGHGPGTPPSAVLALDLGQKTGCAVRNTDGAVASGTVEFKPGRFEGGGMVYLRFRACLQEVDETAGGIGAVYFEEVHSHRGVAAARAYGGFHAPAQPRGRRRTRSHTRGCPWPRSSGTSPARATPTRPR